MKTKGLGGSKTYWVAQNRSNVALREVFRTRKEAEHFVDHRTEGWAESFNSPHGWVVFKCWAIEACIP